MKQFTAVQRLGIGILGVLGTLVIASDLTWAQSDQLSFVIDADSVPDFWQLVTQAEALVLNKVAQAFAANPEITSLDVEILAQRHGAIAPVLATEVSREDWQNDAQIASWTRYFDSAQVLLSYVVFAPQAPEPEPELAELPTSQEQIELEDSLD